MTTQIAADERFRDHIDSFALWRLLTQEQREMLIQHTRFASYAKGEIVHRGPLGRAGTMHILSGTLRIYILSEEGREFTTYFLRAGDAVLLSSIVFAELPICDVSIEAEEKTAIFISESESVRTILAENLAARAEAYERATQRLAEMMWKMQQMIFTSADRRLARFLLAESARTASDEIHLTHEQTAQYLGTAREVVSRLMREFCNEGLVRTSRGRIQILDRTALQQRAGMEELC